MLGIVLFLLHQRPIPKNSDVLWFIVFVKQQMKYRR
nr:MAG TPA: hypothetical protein [Caudoviricetes sp.]